MMKIEKGHYIFHVEEGSLAHRDIEKIASLQEACYEEIIKKLEMETNLTINYYFYDSPQAVGQAYGDHEPCNGFARMPNEVHAVYNKQIKCIGYHEDAHLLSYHAFGRPEHALLREGLAMWFDGHWQGVPIMSWAKHYLVSGQLGQFDKLFHNDTFYHLNHHYTYPLAGAFAAFVIEEQGLKTFLGYFEDSAAGKLHLPSSISQDFKKHLFGMRVPSADLVRIHQFLQTGNSSEELEEELPPVVDKNDRQFYQGVLGSAAIMALAFYWVRGFDWLMWLPIVMVLIALVGLIKERAHQK